MEKIIYRIRSRKRSSMLLFIFFSPFFRFRFYLYHFPSATCKTPYVVCEGGGGVVGGLVGGLVRESVEELEAAAEYIFFCIKMDGLIIPQNAGKSIG